MKEDSQYETLSSCEDYEDYCVGGYYPASLGECVNGKYVIIQKLGWGQFSTVWLAESQLPHSQFALKIQRSDENNLESALAEIRLLKKLREHESDSRWISLVNSSFNIEEFANRNLYNKADFLQIYRPLELYDSFLVNGIHGKHLCSVFQLMGPNLLDLISHYQDKNLLMPLDLVKRITRDILIQLIYLHDIVHLTHGDLKPENILMKLPTSQEHRFVEGLRKYKVKPLSMKYLEKCRGDTKHQANNDISKNSSSTTCNSQNKENILKGVSKRKSKLSEEKKSEKRNISLKIQASDNSDYYNESSQLSNDSFSEDQVSQSNDYFEEGDIDILHWKKIKIDLKQDLHFKICDFGNAEIAYEEEGLIQTRQFRSPEIIIGHPYCPNADIWSVGCIVFEMLTNEFLFKPVERGNISKDQDHLYLMIEILGEFSRSFVQAGDFSRNLFAEDGHSTKLRNGNPKRRLKIKDILVQDFGYTMREARQIEQFLLPMLEYEPSKRISAAECLKSKWLWTQS